MAIYRDEATILVSHDFSEYDKILTLFGKRKGKFSAIVKGVRRLSSKKSGHLQTFSLVKLACAEGKNLDVIVEAEEYYTLDTQQVGIQEYERIGFSGLVLNKFLPEGVSENDIFEMWEEFIRSTHTDVQTWDFVIGVLEKQGFMSNEVKKDLEKLAKKYSKLDVLKSEVDRILNNI
jgi:DNA repair protein RecO